MASVYPLLSLTRKVMVSPSTFHIPSLQFQRSERVSLSRPSPNFLNIPFHQTPPSPNICFSVRDSDATTTLSSCSSSSLSSPLLMLPWEDLTPNLDKEEEDEEMMVNFRFFSPAENKFVKLANQRLPKKISNAFCSGSSNGWLVFVNRDDCGVYLFSPRTSLSSQIIQLPPIQTLPLLTKVFHTNIYFGPATGKEPRKFYQLNSEEISYFFIEKMVMSSSNPNEDHNCVVMIITLYQHVAFCRIGDTAWSILRCRRLTRDGDSSSVADIGFSKKDRLFYALYYDTSIDVWDLNDPDLPRQVKTIHFTNNLPDYVVKVFWASAPYLVESPEGELLQVFRHYMEVDDDGSGSFLDINAPFSHSKDGPTPFSYRTSWFGVYKIDLDQYQMGYHPVEMVECVGDTVLFLGASESFALSAKDYPGLKANSIYFDDHPLRHDPNRFYDTGIYNLEDRSVTPLHHPFGLTKNLSPLWVFCRT